MNPSQVFFGESFINRVLPKKNPEGLNKEYEQLSRSCIMDLMYIQYVSLIDQTTFFH